MSLPDPVELAALVAAGGDCGGCGEPYVEGAGFSLFATQDLRVVACRVCSEDLFAAARRHGTEIREAN